jgi:putative nucleotidyltransferase with HDIG domain
MNKQILFVDDEAASLERVKQELNGVFPDWEGEYAPSAEAALALLGERSFAVVVVDFEIARRENSKLLHVLMKRHPETIRVIAAASAARAQVMRITKAAHRFLAKPIQLDVLKCIIERNLKYRELLRNKTLIRLTTGVGKLPSFPPLYYQILRELQSPEGSLRKVGQMVAEDVALTAKVLQVVNSAYFGLSRKIMTPQQAVALLGLDVLRALVVYTYAFANFKVHPKLEDFSVKRLSQHSLLVGKLAQALAHEEQADKSLEEESLSAGILHDIGKLVLIQSPDQYLEALNYSQARGCSDFLAEYEVFGASHAEVGAYLLGLWGIPEPVVLAVAFHHHPSKLMEDGFGALTTIHAANALVNADSAGNAGDIPGLDLFYLTQIGKRNQMAKWLPLARKVMEDSADLRLI